MRRRFLSIIGFTLCSAAALSDAADKLSPAQAGIPSLAREWSAEDYARAVEIVSSGVMALPRLADEEGRSLLQRLTAPEVLARCADRRRPVMQRAGEFFAVIGNAKWLVDQYVAAMRKGEKVHSEAAQVMAFAFRCARLGMELSDELLPTFPKDEKYPVRVDGVKKMNAGMGNMVAGSLIMFSEKGTYSDEDRSLLLGAVAEVMPVVKRAFEPEARAALRKKLESCRSIFPAPPDRQKLERIIEEIGS